MSQQSNLRAVSDLADTNGHLPSTQTQTLSGAEILDDLRALVRKYCVMPSPEAEIGVVLWCAATHALSALPFAPRLAVTSPTKATGKTRLMEVTSGVSYKPLRNSSASAPSIFRTLGLYDTQKKDDDPPPPTLFIDEADTIFGPKRSEEYGEDLRRLLNAGFQRGWPIKRCDRRGARQVVLDFRTFAMAALAGIGKLPDTVTHRAVNIHMRKRKASEPVSPFRERRDRPILDAMREKLSAWLSDPTVQEYLSNAEPDMAPLEDREADAWESLVMIADLAGGDWPKLARKAAIKLVAEAKDDDQGTLGTQLLHDVHDVFSDFGDDFLPTQTLISSLKTIEGSPWAEHPELNAHRMGRLLGEFCIRSQRDTTGTVRGYARSSFVDAWERYPTTFRT